jgi:hypothetical protein
MLTSSVSSFGFGRRAQLVSSSSQIPGISIYFDATNGSFNPNSLDGTSISQWTDSSGASHNANPDGGASVKPTVKTGIQNGKNILRFDGGDNLSVTSATYLQSKTGFTMYVVAKVSSYAAGNTALTSSNATGGGSKIYHDGTHWGVRIAQCTGISTVTGDNNFHIFGLIYDGTGATNANKVRFRYGGADQTLTYTGTADSATSSTINVFYIGNENKSELFSGDIGEVSIWTRTLNTSEILAVEAYLKNKWGL